LRRILILLLIVGLGVVSACSTRAVPKTEFEFANKLAQMDLWKEAFYRWNKLIEEGKENAALYNNLAIAYEERGEFENAEKAYQKALKLSPSNSTIQNNYDKFKKMLNNDKKEKNGKEKDKNKK